MAGQQGKPHQAWQMVAPPLRDASLRRSDVVSRVAAGTNGHLPATPAWADVMAMLPTGQRRHWTEPPESVWSARPLLGEYEPAGQGEH